MRTRAGFPATARLRQASCESLFCLLLSGDSGRPGAQRADGGDGERRRRGRSGFLGSKAAESLGGGRLEGPGAEIKRWARSTLEK